MRDITRRESFKHIGMFVVSPVLPLAKLVETAIQDIRTLFGPKTASAAEPVVAAQPEYTNLARVTETELRSLDEVLQDAPLEQRTQNDNFPAIVYLLEVRPSADGTSYTRGAHKLNGNAVILNNDGFFVTSHSVVSEFIDPKENELMLVYSPMHGFASVGRILAYSEGSKIALGKIDVPPDCNIKPTRIAAEEAPADSRICTFVYGRIDYIDWKGLMSEISGATEFSRDRSGNVMYEQRKLIVKDPAGALGGIMLAGNARYGASDDKFMVLELGRNEANVMGRRLAGDMVSTKNLGSPIFRLDDGVGLDGRLYGVYVSEESGYRCAKTSGLRKMIQQYIAFCRR